MEEITKGVLDVIHARNSLTELSDAGGNAMAQAIQSEAIYQACLMSSGHSREQMVLAAALILARIEAMDKLKKLGLKAA